MKFEPKFARNQFYISGETVHVPKISNDYEN
jgi:hypothetical protein